MFARTLHNIPRRPLIAVGAIVVTLFVIVAIGASSSNQRSGLTLPPTDRNTASGSDSGSGSLVDPATTSSATKIESDGASAQEGSLDKDVSKVDGAAGIAGDEMSTEEGRGAGETAAAAPAKDSSLNLGLKIIRNGTVDLIVKKSSFDDDVREVERIASRYNGYVSSSTRSGSGKDLRSATIKIRVPAARFDAALDDIRGSGGKVVNLTTTSDDVTSTYVDSESRLRHSKAVEGRLLALLAKANTVGEALSIQTRLDSVQESIELEKGQLKMLDQQTSLATIDVSLKTKVTAAEPVEEGTNWGVRDAFEDAAHAFVDSFSNGIVAIAGSLPGLLILLGIGLAGRAAWRRRGSKRSASGGDVTAP